MKFSWRNIRALIKPLFCNESQSSVPCVATTDSRDGQIIAKHFKAETCPRQRLQIIP